MFPICFRAATLTATTSIGTHQMEKDTLQPEAWNSSSLVQVWFSEQRGGGGQQEACWTGCCWLARQLKELSENKPPKTCIGGSWPKIRVCVRELESTELKLWCAYTSKLLHNNQHQLKSCFWKKIWDGLLAVPTTAEWTSSRKDLKKSRNAIVYVILGSRAQ